MTTAPEALSPPVLGVIEEFSRMISIDGGRLELREASPNRLHFELILEDAECAEYVMARAHLEGILATRLSQVSSSPPDVQISDPREEGSDVTSLLGPIVTKSEPTTTNVGPEDFDVVSLRNRRADNRRDRTAVGDLLERVTWSLLSKTALVGWKGAYADPRFARMTYREADEAANQAANTR